MMAAIVLTKAERNTGGNDVEKAEEMACLIKGLHTSTQP